MTTYRPGYYKSLLKKLNDTNNNEMTMSIKKENLILMNNKEKVQNESDSQA